MSDVHIFGHNIFEVLGVQQMLASVEMTGTCPVYFREKDIPEITTGRLIVCLGSEPLLGWAKNIMSIKRLLKKISGEIIVLAPDQISGRLMHHRRLGFIRGRVTARDILKPLSTAEKKYRKMSGYWPWLLSNTPEQGARVSGLNIKTVYHHRNVVVEAFGFTTFHYMRLCLAGCSEKSISRIYHELYSLQRQISRKDVKV